MDAKEELELRLGGVVVFPCIELTLHTFFEERDAGFDRSRDHRDAPQIDRVLFDINNAGSKIVAAVFGLIGPIRPQYINLTPTGEISNNIENALMLTRLCL